MKTSSPPNPAGTEFPPASMSLRSRLAWGTIYLLPLLFSVGLYKTITENLSAGNWTQTALFSIWAACVIGFVWSCRQRKIKTMRLTDENLIIVFNGGEWPVPLESVIRVEPAPHVFDEAVRHKRRRIGINVFGTVGFYHNRQFGFYSGATNCKNAVLLKLAGDPDDNVVVSPRDVPAFIEAVRQHIQK